MALATRELELIIIARDRTSAVLARVGGALAILGAGAARVGAAGVGFFVDATKEAIDFRKTIALAFTQAEIAGLEFDDVLNLVRDSARITSVPIEDLSDSVFDIFSTLTLDNIGQAADLLDLFAQSAVAGDAPIRDIGRATIAWLNALNLAPTAENASRILAAQFELVRKGAGTYEEFAGVMGKAIPPFVAANQTIETMAASLAFLTKNGLSAAEASTSASRAVELLFGPKAIVGLESIGIAIEDDNGKFRDMRGLLTDVVAHFEGMGDAEKKLAFKEIFGQGRIQARRFFDLILAEGNFEEFLFLLDEMEDAAPGLANAYDIMFAQPAVQIDHLRNRWGILVGEIGDVFIPLLVGRVLPAIDRLLDLWEELDDLQRENIVQWSALATLFLTIGGGITAAGGGILLIIGLLNAFTGSLIVTAFFLGGWVLAVSAIAGAIALALLDWEKFKELAGPIWEKILEKIEPVVDWLEDEWPEAWAVAEGAWNNVVRFFEEDWPRIWENVKTAFIDAWDAIVAFWNEFVAPEWEGFTDFFKEKMGVLGEQADKFEGFFEQWAPVFEQVMKDIGPIVGAVMGLIVAFARLLIATFVFIVQVVAFIWEEWGDEIVAVVLTFVTSAGQFILGFLLLMAGIFDFFTALMSGDWEGMWEGMETAARGIFSLILSFISLIWGLIKGIFTGFISSLKIDWSAFWNALLGTVANIGSSILGWIDRIAGGLARLNPFVTRSPSLVSQVTRGYQVMTRAVDMQLHEMSRTANRLVPRISGALEQLGGTNIVPARIGPLPGGILGDPVPSIGQQINIAKLESRADPFEIASEIGWHALNS